MPTIRQARPAQKPKDLNLKEKGDAGAVAKSRSNNAPAPTVDSGQVASTGMDSGKGRRLEQFEGRPSADDPEMRGHRSRTASGRLHQVRSDSAVEKNATLKERAPELVEMFEGKTVGELRELFGGRSVTQIGQMPKIERQAVVFDALIDDPELQPRDRKLSVRVPTKAFMARSKTLIGNLVRAGVKNYGAKVDDGLAKDRFSGLLLETYQELKKAGGRKKVDRDALETAYAAAVEQAVAGVAGDGLDGKWISLKEARQLPPELRKMYGGVRSGVKYSDWYSRAYLDPFPDGVVDRDLTFQNYLGTVGIRAAASMVEKHHMFDRLQSLWDEPELAKKDADGQPARIELDDGTEAWKVDELVVDGKALTAFRSDPPYLLLKKGRELLVVGLEDKFGSREMHLHPFRKKGSRWERGSETHYSEKSIFESMSLPGRAKRSKLETLRDRAGMGMGSVDASAMARLCGVLAHEANDAAAASEVEAFGELFAAKQSSVVAAFFDKGHAVDIFREIAAAVPSFDDISLGDADLDIAISDKLVDTEWEYDADGTEREVTKTLVEGEGKLLTFHNNASGLTWCVELDALEQGALKIHSFYGGALPTIDIRADGKAGGKMDKAPFSSVAFSMLWARDELRDMLVAQAGAADA